MLFYQPMDGGYADPVAVPAAEQGVVRAMRGTNRALYEQLSRDFSIDIVASGGVSSLEDVIALRKLDLYGAIIGKAYYTGAIDLREALEAAK